MRPVALVLLAVFAAVAYAGENWMGSAAVVGGFLAGAVLWGQGVGAPDRAERVAHAKKRAAGLESDVMARVLEMARSGNKIGAIKELREVTGVGLKDAKDMVEALLGNGK